MKKNGKMSCHIKKKKNAEKSSTSTKILSKLSESAKRGEKNVIVSKGKEITIKKVNKVK